MSHYISPLTTLAGCLLLPIVTFGPGSVLTSVYTLYSPQLKGAGSFHIHRKTMKELGTLAVLGVREATFLTVDKPR